MTVGARRQGLVALSLYTPLLVFTLVFFVLPILSFLPLAFKNDEVRAGLPRTSRALQGWSRSDVPGRGTYEALLEDLKDRSIQEATTIAAARLNFDIAGFRSLIASTASRVRATEGSADRPSGGDESLAAFSIFGAQPRAAAPAEVRGGSARERLASIDPRWTGLAYWAAIERGTWRWTPLYMLAALDLRLSDTGAIVWAPADRQIYLALIGRTFLVSVNVTLICVALGFPVALFISRQAAGRANLLLFLVLVPLWTSILVRTTAWVVLLQGEGLLNDLIVRLGLSDRRLPLIHNRFGVYVAMVHICLPFALLPIYSAMKATPDTYTRAAASLGADPIRVFIKVYLPLVYPGMAAGALLVFIMALGFYITPALVGGPRDQMLSYFIAASMNQDLNWGFAAALSIILLGIVTITMVALRKFANVTVRL